MLQRLTQKIVNIIDLCVEHDIQIVFYSSPDLWMPFMLECALPTETCLQITSAGKKDDEIFIDIEVSGWLYQSPTFFD